MARLKYLALALAFSIAPVAVSQAALVEEVIDSFTLAQVSPLPFSSTDTVTDIPGDPIPGDFLFYVTFEGVPVLADISVELEVLSGSIAAFMAELFTGTPEAVIASLGSATGVDSLALWVSNVVPDMAFFVAYSGSVSASYEFQDTIEFTQVTATPLPAAVWLFLSALVGLGGFSRLRNRKSAV